MLRGHPREELFEHLEVLFCLRRGRVPSLGFGVSGFEFRVSDFGFRVRSSVSVSGFRVSDFDCQGLGFGFRFQVWGFEFQVSGFGLRWCTAQSARWSRRGARAAS